MKAAISEEQMHQSLGGRSGSGTIPFIKPSADAKRLSTLTPTDEVAYIELENLLPDPDQPRKEFSEESLIEMGNSLATHGQIQPIVVRPSYDDDGKWIIIAGERRYRGAQKAGLKSLLCVLEEKDHSKEDLLIKQLVENCLREGLRPIDQANAFKALQDAKDWNNKQLAEHLHIAESAVSQALALLEHDEDTQKKVNAGELPASVAYEVTKLEDPDERRGVLETVISKKMSRKEARDVVKEKRGKGSAAKDSKPTKPLALTFKTPKKWAVTINPTKKKVSDQEILAELKALVGELEAKISAQAA
jgi:ParB family chromosome partitioning protein